MCTAVRRFKELGKRLTLFETMLKILSVFLGFLFLSNSLNAQTVDYAIHASAYAGAEGRYIYITRNPAGAQEIWYVVGGCSSAPNLSFYISLMPVATEQYVFLTNVPTAADKTVCITNTEELDENTLRALKLID